MVVREHITWADAPFSAVPWALEASFTSPIPCREPPAHATSMRPDVLDRALGLLLEKCADWTATGCVALDPLVDDAPTGCLFSSFLRLRLRADGLIPRFSTPWHSGNVPIALEDAQHHVLPWAANAEQMARHGARLGTFRSIQRHEIGALYHEDNRVFSASAGAVYVVYASMRSYRRGPRVDWPFDFQAVPDALLRSLMPAPPPPADDPTCIYAPWGHRRVGDMAVRYHRGAVGDCGDTQPGYFVHTHAQAVVAAEDRAHQPVPRFVVEETYAGDARQHVDFCNLTLVPGTALLRVTTPGVRYLVFAAAVRLADAEWAHKQRL